MPAAIEGHGQLKTNTTLGNRYLIQEVIGVGGMGAVYRARDLHFPNIERYLAIKEMINQAPDADAKRAAIENFEREAHILATLTHPAIPKIFDFFSDDNSSYLVLEYIPGKDLELLLEKTEGFLPIYRVVEWAIEVCDVLDYLHNHKPEAIIFRDVKPSNIMINEHGHVVLVDFGIAKLFKTGQKGTMIGTEGYSPPEQYRGEATHLADIYALGASLHHLLTGRDPRLEPPFTFSERPISQANPAVSEELEEVVYKALQYNPQNRYQTAVEMKEALRRTILKPASPNQIISEPGTQVIRLERKEESDRLLWSFEAADEVRGSPIVGDGVVYFGSYDHNLYAINGADGGFLWKYETEGGIVGKPILFEDVIFFGSEDQHAYAISTNSGRLVWSFSTDGPIRCSPQIAQNHLLLGSDDGMVYAINLVSGKVTWKVDTGAAIRSTPFITETEVIVGNENGEVLSIDYRGTIRWSFRAKRAVTSSPWVDKGVAYFASLDSMVYAVDCKSGWAIWRFRMGKGSVSSPFKYNNFLYIGSADGYIYCIDASNSREIWKFQTGHQVGGSPVVYKDQVFCGSVDGNVYCLDCKSGKLRWKYETGGPITSTPTIYADTLYIGSLDHYLYAIKV
jgi:eukaryotic-like serine/threonine-protein kinase